MKVAGVHKATHLMLNADSIFRSFVAQIVSQYYLTHSPNCVREFGSTAKREFGSFSNCYHDKFPNIEFSHKLKLMYFYSVLFLISSATGRDIHHSVCSMGN